MARTRTFIATAAATLAVALVGTGLTAGDPATAAKPQSKKNPAATGFALKGWGYGTNVSGGDVPSGSGPTGYEVFGCTNRAGIDKANHQAAVNLPGLGSVSAVKTRAWTTRQGGVVSAWAQNTIGQVVLSDSPLGTLLLDAVSTTARAYHDSKGFHSTATTDLAKLRFQPPVGPAQTLDLPAPGQPVEIPGFATVTLAHSLKGASSHRAFVYGNGLKVQLHATHTTVRIAHAVAQIERGVVSGLFHGASYAVGGNAAGGALDLGRNPLLKMKCLGTGGKLRTRSAAAADLGGQVVIGAAKSQQKAQQNKRRAWGFESSRLASLNLGDGQLRIEGVVGRVNVSRGGDGFRTLRTSTTGTSIGKIIVNGEVRELPLDQTLEIPGVAKLQPRVVEKIPNGLSVTALRITLLDGTGAVIDLGNAELQIRRPVPHKK